MNPTSPAAPCVLPDPTDPKKRRAHKGLTKREYGFWTCYASLLRAITPSKATQDSEKPDTQIFLAVARNALVAADLGIEVYEGKEIAMDAKIMDLERGQSNTDKALTEVLTILKRHGLTLNDVPTLEEMQS